MKNYFRQLFDERAVSDENKKKLWQYYYNTLAKGVDVGYNSKLEIYDPALAHSLKYNIAEFSAFKETSFRKQAEALLTKDGKIVPWNEFIKQANELNFEYNNRWLKTEYHHTVGTANMIEKWNDFVADADLYPNLKYVTVGDARVREQHKAWDGLILPINHPFWEKHLPPQDWGCRCNVEQTDEEPSKTIPDLKTKSAFNNNAALSGKIFNEIPYSEALSANEIKEAKNNLSSFLQSEKNIINTKNKYVKISLGADRQDLKRNYEVANICAKKLNMDFLIRSHSNIDGIKNPEYLILKKYLGDRKSILGINNMRKVIDDSKKQMMDLTINPNQIPHFIVWDFDLIKNLDVEQIAKTLSGKITENRGRTIKGMIFQYKGKAVQLSREQIVNRDFEALKKLL